MKRILMSLAVAAMAVAGLGIMGSALADQPHPWQIGLQDPATPVAEQLHWLHNILLIVITIITLFVLGLLIYVMVRFREKRNPVPSMTTHNTMLEVAWTVIPVIILVLMAIPSFRLLYLQDRAVNPEMTIKAIGRQWYWSYEYPDNGNFTFDAYLVKDKEPRLLQTDNAVVLPINTKVRVLLTASDVLHSWTVPAFGVKTDAVTGRLNETWVEITKPGTYYGQCSELCGIGHAYMPIKVIAVSKEEFKTWVAEAQKKFNKADGTPPGGAPTQSAAMPAAR